MISTGAIDFTRKLMYDVLTVLNWPTRTGHPALLIPRQHQVTHFDFRKERKGYARDGDSALWKVLNVFLTRYNLWYT